MRSRNERVDELMRLLRAKHASGVPAARAAARQFGSSAYMQPPASAEPNGSVGPEASVATALLASQIRHTSGGLAAAPWSQAPLAEDAEVASIVDGHHRCVSQGGASSMAGLAATWPPPANRTSSEFGPDTLLEFSAMSV